MSFPQTLTLKAFAKINLSLDITGILENGYHQLEMIMQSVSLHDKVTITTSDASQGISLSCSVPSLCPNEQNTAYKAANLFFKHCEIRPAVSIHIEKRYSQSGRFGRRKRGCSRCTAWIKSAVSNQFDTEATV